LPIEKMVKIDPKPTVEVKEVGLYVLLSGDTW
jgi:hypothetical protein